MKIKNISVGDSVQIKKGKHLDYFKDDEICQVIDIDAGDKYGLDVLIDGQKGLDWVKHKHLKKPEPQLKQLDQSIFDGLDEKWRFAAVDLSGEAWAYREQPKIDKGDDRWSPSNTPPNSIGTGYDTSNWQNSLIERDIAKELLEVDLSSELTGSELCRAMLARGDKYVMCGVSDVSDLDAASNKYDDLISDAVTDFDDTDGLFGTASMRWIYAVPINNQGEPLTASEVGL